MELYVTEESDKPPDPSPLSHSLPAARPHGPALGPPRLPSPLLQAVQATCTQLHAPPRIVHVPLSLEVPRPRDREQIGTLHPPRHNSATRPRDGPRARAALIGVLPMAKHARSRSKSLGRARKRAQGRLASQQPEGSERATSIALAVASHAGTKWSTCNASWPDCEAWRPKSMFDLYYKLQRVVQRHEWCVHPRSRPRVAHPLSPACPPNGTMRELRRGSSHASPSRAAARFFILCHIIASELRA